MDNTTVIGRYRNACMAIGKEDPSLTITDSHKDIPLLVEQRDTLVAALIEMLAAHSNENLGVGASMRRIKAKEQARAALLLVQP